MGAAQSSEPRSVSMDNPTQGVIDISDDVVKRLKTGIIKQARENAAAVTATTVTPSLPPKQEEVRQAPAPKSAPPQRAASYPSQPYPLPAGGATLTAMDVHRLKEKELQENDALWRKRMADLEQTLNKTNAILEKEYTAAVDDVRKRFATTSVAQQLPPCQDLKAELIACYRAHPGETLMCAEHVAKFRNCVNAHRVQKLDAMEETPAAASATTAKAVKAG